MRIFFIDPHLNTCGKNIFHFFRKDKSYSKYGYLIEYALKKKIKLGFYIENKLGLSTFLFIIFIYLWCLGNKYNIFKIKIIFKEKSINKDDVLLFFIHVIFNSSIIKEFKGKKIIHTTHYGINTKKIANYIKNVKNFTFIGENNLIKNSTYFQNFFGFYQENFYTLNITYQKKFINYKLFKKRLNKSIVFGTFQSSLKNDSEDIITFLGKNTSWHPMRKIIFKNNKKIKNEIDSFIYKASDYHIYISLDVVKLYNNYKMFIAPEEIFDLPTISIACGMICGCAYIGKIDPMYIDIGMIDGIHYIGYNGTLEDLILKIKYYQKNNTELEKIATNGYNFAIKNFNQKVVATKFYNYINSISE